MLFQMRIVILWVISERSRVQQRRMIGFLSVCLGMGVLVHNIRTGSLYGLPSKPNIKIQVMFA